MHEFFQRAINPQSHHECLKRKLRPLTLGHIFLLRELGSPILDGGPECYGDVLLAVLVCSRSHRAARRLISSDFKLWLLGTFWGMRCRRMDLIQEAKKLNAYFRAEQKPPPVAQLGSDESRSIGSPFEWQLYCMLRSEFGMSNFEALNVPMATANCFWAVNSEIAGRIQLSTATNSIESAIHGIWERRRQSVRN